jgi:hypothetical protein
MGAENCYPAGDTIPLMQDEACATEGHCENCEGRGRVWVGDSGETEPCPACAVYGVWMERAVKFEDWPEPADWAIEARFARSFAKAEAERLAEQKNASGAYRAEVRRR